MPKSALPDHLKNELHKDWPWPFCYIPRSWTSYKLTQPPKLICGHKVYDWTGYEGKLGPQPCQRYRGAWQLTWPLYFSYTFNNGKYIRIFCRWDDVDFYFTVPSFFFGRVKHGLKD